MQSDENKKNAASDDWVRREILLHQVSFWRFLSWGKMTAQKMIIWGIFFGILWLLSDFFSLIFLTFVLSFVSTSIVRMLGKRFPSIGWRTRVTAVFLLLIALMTGVVWMLVPQVKSGVVHMQKTIEDFPAKWNDEIEPKLVEDSSLYRRLLGLKEELDDAALDVETQPTTVRKTDSHPASRPQLWDVRAVRDTIDGLKKTAVERTPTYLKDAVTGLSALFMLIFLSTLFSFLIVLDLDGLKREVMKLDQTKLKGFYRETMLNIVKFGSVVGKVFEAQAVIALVNTCLTAIGLYFLGIPQIPFLCIGVFICGFIPVAGVFISSVPICLVGLFSGGFGTMFLLIGFITVIHMIEAYILNPRIMGATLHVNPILVLIILTIGHHMGGIWGFLLGVPVCYYFFTYVIKREEREIGLRARFRRKLPNEPEPE